MYPMSLVFIILMSCVAFLLNHSNEYSTAIMAAIAEYIIELYLFPRLKSWLCIFRYIGNMPICL